MLRRWCLSRQCHPPHFIAGVSGRSFHTPFANPPFRGLSSPVVNIAWSLVNLTVAYVLLEGVAALDLHQPSEAGLTGLGFGMMSLFVARSVTKMQREAIALQPRD